MEGQVYFYSEFTMRYEFAHKHTGDWSAEESKVISDTVTFISSPITGDPITEIGRYLAKVTGVKYLLIGRFVSPENDKVQTICFFNQDQQLANITYNLKNTPCYHVYQQHVCYYPYGVQEEFPEDADLIIMGVNSYMGAALRDYTGESIGLIVLLHDKTIENPGLIDYLLSLVSPILEKQLAG
jgi:hypothetical protein